MTSNIIMEIDILLEPISVELPCGPDPEDYDGEKALSEAFSQLKAKLDGEMKNGVKQLPRWPDIQEEAMQLARRTKHLQLAAILAEAGLMTEGFSGFRDGLRLLRLWCENFWNDLHPREVRHPLVDGLSYPKFLIKPRRVILAKGPGGSFSFEDYETALDNEKSDDKDLVNQARLVLGTFKAASKDQHAANLAAMEEALKHSRAIENLFDERLPEEPANLLNLKDLFKRMIDVLRPMASSSAEAATNPGSDSAPAASSVTSGFSAPAASGQITDRESAGEQLERIALYFEKNEPSSPLPYLLRRARRCIGLSFMDLIDELAPDKGHAVQVLKPAELSEETVNE